MSSRVVRSTFGTPRTVNNLDRCRPLEDCGDPSRKNGRYSPPMVSTRQKMVRRAKARTQMDREERYSPQST
ncbi:hypothetical protein ACFFX0_31705 [Citricoccus parietis]|uniref:Uncharacterized protein n=1 Tax=Citricoccus parietis TaxID=592307 RepID=A0ABV5G982_9MICC